MKQTPYHLTLILALGITTLRADPIPTGDPQPSAVPSVGKTNAESITGQFPIQLQPNKNYILKGVLLLQVQDEGLVCDLLPETAFSAMAQASSLPHADFENSIASLENAGVFRETSQRAILLPEDKGTYKGLNFQTHTLLTCEVTFQRYQSETLVSGEQVRLPIFIISKVLVFGNPRTIISLRSLDNQFKEIDSELVSGDVVGAANDLDSIIVSHTGDARIPEYRVRVGAAVSRVVMTAFQNAINGGDYNRAVQGFLLLKKLGDPTVSMSSLAAELVTLANRLLDDVEVKIGTGDLKSADDTLTRISQATPSSPSFGDIQGRMRLLSDKIINKARQPLLNATKASKVYYGETLVDRNFVYFKMTFLSTTGDGTSTIKVQDLSYPQFYKTYQGSIVGKPTIASNLGDTQPSRTECILRLTATNSDGVVYDENVGSVAGGLCTEYNDSMPGIHLRRKLFWGLSYGQTESPSTMVLVPDRDGCLMGGSQMSTGIARPGELFADPLELAGKPFSLPCAIPGLGIEVTKPFADMDKGIFVFRNTVFDDPGSAGLQHGDIITSFNGADLSNLTIDQFQSLVKALPAHTQVPFSCMHQGWQAQKGFLTILDVPAQAAR